jgi:hypothetical protein
MGKIGMAREWPNREVNWGNGGGISPTHAKSCGEKDHRFFRRAPGSRQRACVS